MAGQYRREIDGLRAIAVTSVLLSHAGIRLFAGGFLGVDVFFVISGYLITGIILRELDRGHFSIVDFYDRRVRRILPPLFVVIATCLAAGWVLMGADAYQNLGQSVVATTLFSNNILLLMTSGYWDMESQFKPLLHTWSLGVEEQYYFAVPLVLILVHRFARRHVAATIAAIGLVSFALCLWSVRHQPIANFYLLHTRAWELAVGGWTVTMPALANRNSNILTWLGLVMIVGAILLVPAGTATPALVTLPPVLGTALVLACGRSGSAKALLSSAPMVWIGLISYSTYLWHQPLFAFARVASPTDLGWQTYGVLILLAYALGWASWRFIERPFRDRRRVSRRILAVTLLPTALALILFGLTLHLRGGLPWRFELSPDAEPAGGFKEFNMGVYARKQDRFALSGERPRLLVIGNSTARDFVNMLDAAGQGGGSEIVYRDDLDYCNVDQLTGAQRYLVRSATLIVIVYDHSYSPTCSGYAVSARPALRGKVVFVGPKDFGVNLNPVARLPLADRPAAKVRLSQAALEAERRYSAITPPSLYVDIIRAVSPDGLKMPIFDERGNILSEDRVHLTRAGARYFARRVFRDPAWLRAVANDAATPGSPRN